MLDTEWKGTKIEILHGLLGEELFDEFEVDWHNNNPDDCWLEYKVGFGDKLAIWVFDGNVIASVDREFVDPVIECEVSHGATTSFIGLGDPELKEKLVKVCKHWVSFHEDIL